jgi:hypothetical protein
MPKNIRQYFKKNLLPSALFLVTATATISLPLINTSSPSHIKLVPKRGFVNVIKDSGIKLSRGTAGASWGDYNNDGYLDLLILSETSTNGPVLYRNNGNGTFTDVTAHSGIKLDRTYWAGVFGDYDNDGCEDIYFSGHQGVTGGSPDKLYHNNCDGTFTDVTASAGISDNLRGRGAAWADYDNDGYLDIYVANYGNNTDGSTYISEPNILYHNNGNGTFTNVTEKLGVTGYANCPGLTDRVSGSQKTIGLYKQSFQPIWFDYNNDGLVDLYVSTDSDVSPLYRNNGNGTFTDVTASAGLCHVGSGMGVTVGDYDGSGNLSIYMTNTGPNFLWHNNGDGTFSFKARDLGLSDELQIGWGTNFFDYDNDGNLDLYVTNGDVVNRTNLDSKSHRLFQKVGKTTIDRLFKNDGGGRFTEVGSQEGIYGDDAKEAAAFGDYDNDGFIDIFVATGFAKDKPLHRLYHNTPNGNHWLTVKLIGTKSNRDAVGAKLTLSSSGKKQVRQVISGSSYLAQNSLWQTFGLGKETKIDWLEIGWPSGIKQTLTDVKVDQKLVVTEPKN